MLRMRIIRNSYIPFRGFTAMNLFGVLFVRREAAELAQETLNHEKIHSAQMREMLYIPFYICYLLEWLLRLLLPGNAYRNISFEQEAYKYQNDLSYLSRRGRFAWFRFLFRAR